MGTTHKSSPRTTQSVRRASATSGRLAGSADTSASPSGQVASDTKRPGLLCRVKTVIRWAGKTVGTSGRPRRRMSWIGSAVVGGSCDPTSLRAAFKAPTDRREVTRRVSEATASEVSPVIRTTVDP